MNLNYLHVSHGVKCSVCNRIGLLYNCSCSTNDSENYEVHSVYYDDGWRGDFHNGTYLVECGHSLAEEHYYCDTCGIDDLETAEHKKKCVHGSSDRHD